MLKNSIGQHNKQSRQYNNTNIPLFYSSIVSSGPFKFTTVSPPYDPDYEDIYDTFMSIMCRNRKIFNHILIIVEMTSNLRLHFHMMYNLKPEMSKRHYYLINKSFRGAQKWNVLVTSSPPKEGAAYLMKDTEIKDYIKEYVFDHNSLQEFAEEKKQHKKQLFKQNYSQLDPYQNKPIPQWWLNINKYDSSSDED